MTGDDALRVERVDDVVVIGFTQTTLRYGQDTDRNQLLDEIERLLGSDDIRKAVVNFDGVQICSNSTLGCLITVSKTLEARGGGIHLCHVPAHIGQKLHYLNLEHLFQVHESLSDAISSFNG